MYFSKSTGGFYTTEIHGKQIPEDAVEISETEHAELLAGQANGKTIIADLDGRPSLANPAPPTPAQVWAGVKVKRDTIKEAGVKVGDKWFHSDDSSRIQFIGLKDQARDVIAAGLPDSTRLQKLGQDLLWKTMDGSFVSLSVKHVFDIVAAIGDLDAYAFAAAETHRAAIVASSDPADYDFSTGWPKVYADEVGQ